MSIELNLDSKKVFQFTEFDHAVQKLHEYEILTPENNEALDQVVGVNIRNEVAQGFLILSFAEILNEETREALVRLAQDTEEPLITIFVSELNRLSKVDLLTLENFRALIQSGENVQKVAVRLILARKVSTCCLPLLDISDASRFESKIELPDLPSDILEFIRKDTSEFSIESSHNIISRLHAIRSITNIYERITFRENKKFFWSVRVLPDGLGDLFNCFNAIKIVSDHHPNWQHHVVITAQRELPKTLPLNEYNLSSEHVTIEHVKREITKDGFYSLILGGLMRGGITTQDAHLLTEFEQIVPKWDQRDICVVVSQPPYVARDSNNFWKKTFSEGLEIWEYDVQFGNKEFPSMDFHIMGLQPGSQGIFILSPKVPDNFENPDLEDLFKTKEVYMNYGWANERFVRAVASLQPPEKTELHVMAKPPFLETREWFQEILKDTEIKDVIFKHGRMYQKFEIGKGKMTLYWHSFPPIVHKDMIRAIALAQEPVGCTGNVSISEVFGLKKLPFYNNRDHSNFWMAAKHVAQHLGCHNLYRYMEETAGTLPIQGKFEKIEVLRGDATYKTSLLDIICSAPHIDSTWLADIKKEYMEKFLPYIREYRDIKHAYIGLIHQKLAHKENPILIEIEKTILEETRNRTITPTEGLLVLEETLYKLGYFSPTL